MEEYKFQLPPNALSDLRQAKRINDDLEREIAKAKIAKIDVSDLEQRLKENKKKILAYKQAYFPNEDF